MKMEKMKHTIKTISMALFGTVIGLAFFGLSSIDVKAARPSGNFPDGYYANDWCYFIPDQDAETGTLYIDGAVQTNESGDPRISLPEGLLESKIKSIIAESTCVLPDSCHSLFARLSTCETIDLKNANCANVTSMSYMFFKCNSLKSVDMSELKALSLTDAYYMFSECEVLESINLTGFTTSNKLATMNGMFSQCHNLQSVDLGGFNTQNVSTMWGLFNECHSLKTLDLSGFDTTHVGSMERMFWECTALEELDLSSFKASSLANMTLMLGSCTSLQTVKFGPNWDVSNVNAAASMFFNCQQLQTIYVAKEWNLTKLHPQLRYNMFKYCPNLVGGCGTKYDGSNYKEGNDQHYDDYKYACIDGGESKPGYFTADCVPMADLVADTNSFDFTIYVPVLDNTKTYSVKYNGTTYTDKVTLAGKDYIAAKAGFAARELADKKDVIVYEDENMIYKNKISVADYLKKLLNDETYGKLAGEMLRYGAAAQVYFNKETDETKLANYGTTGYQLDNTDFVNFSVPGEPLNASKINTALSGAGVTYGGINMTFTSDFTLMFALKVPDGTTASQYLDDEDKVRNMKNILSTNNYILAPEVESLSYDPDNYDKYIIMRFKNIPILKADYAYLNFDYDAQISIIQYLYQATQSEKVSEDLKPLCKALYLYYAAAYKIKDSE